MNFDERTLIKRAQGGDGAAFEALMARHAPLVYNLALRMLRDPHEAEDLAQEAFLRAWRGLPAFRADARFGTWLYRIVTNLCYSRWPAMKTQLDDMDIDDGPELPDERQPADAGVLSAELRAHLHAAIDGLPDGYRLLITLRHLQDMSYNDIADTVGMPLGTVKTGIHRARRQLQAAIEHYERAAGSAGPPPRAVADRPGSPRPDAGRLFRGIMDVNPMEAGHA